VVQELLHRSGARRGEHQTGAAREEDHHYELTARARDGKTTVVSFNATTFYDRDRKLEGVFAAARDVTSANVSTTRSRSRTSS